MEVLKENLHVLEVLSCAKLLGVLGSAKPLSHVFKKRLFQAIVEVEKNLIFVRVSFIFYFGHATKGHLLNYLADTGGNDPLNHLVPSRKTTWQTRDVIPTSLTLEYFVGIFISPEKPGLIPTFCKRINRTSTVVGRWVAAFEERRQTTFSVTKFIHNKQ